jgi:hypothetical protein
MRWLISTGTFLSSAVTATNPMLAFRFRPSFKLGLASHEHGLLLKARSSNRH